MSRPQSQNPAPERSKLLRSWAAVSALFLALLASVNFARELHNTVGVLVDFDGNVHWAGQRILDGAAAVPDGLTAWPPTATVFVAPIALFPYWLEVALWVAISVSGFLAGLWVVGCRDVRALIVAVLSPPALACLLLGNASLLLAAGVAVVWANREKRPLMAGIVAGATIAAKLWLWPLFVFLLLARRWLSLAAALAWCASSALVWLALSPSTLRDFPAWADRMVAAHIQWGIGLAPTLFDFGLSTRAASVLALVAGLVVLVPACRIKDELALLAVCLASALVGTPLVWEHYYVVLFVPIAVAAPRLTPLWFVPYLAGLKLLWPITRMQFIVAGLAALLATAWVVQSVAKRSERGPRSAVRVLSPPCR